MTNKQKRYRRPKVEAGQIKMQRGKLDGYIDMCIFYGDDVPRCDRALVFNVFGSKRQRIDIKTMKTVFDASFLEDLEARGYDLDTLKFSIKIKAN